MDTQERYDLIIKNLQEVFGEDELKKKLDSGKEFCIYWGTTPTGSVSAAYFFPMLKVADFLKAGCRVKILLADLHAVMDNTPWNIIEERYQYYREAITTILKTIKVPLEKLEFVKGSSFQLSGEYFRDVLRLSTITTISECKKSAAEVVKLGDNPKLSGFIYPSMQALDEEYLKVDAQFGGMDQRKIFVYAREYLPKINYEPRIELLNPIIRGLIGEKMSSSVASSKIDLMDDEKVIKSKINKADFIEGNSENGIMAFLKYVIFIIKSINNENLVIERPEKFGGNLTYHNYEELEKDVIEKKVHPLDVKNSFVREINQILSTFRNNSKLVDLYKKAYPDQ